MMLLLVGSAVGFNGDLTELQCPEDCDCHFFRVNWVTDCSESNLTEIPYEEIDPNVYILDLNGNDIADVEAFPPDVKLRRLQLADNRLAEVRQDSFAELHYIIDADFANNRIRRVDPFTFENKAGFLTLELQDNPLDRVEGPFLYSNTLLYLDISNCNLTHLNEHFFANISSLNTLDLSNNPLVSLVGSAFQPLKTLGTLKLNHCNLTFIGEDVFAMQSNLKSLELSGNKFQNVQWPGVFNPLLRLEYIDLRNSGLTARDVPATTFAETVYLRTLILAENDLGGDFDVAATIGEKLVHLEILDLSHCHLSEPLSEDAFANATKLKTLYLSGNTLLASDLLLALAPLIKLQKLTLSHSGLSKLPDTLHKFMSLIELDISNNPLDDVFVKLLAPLRTLEYLNMGYSNLSYIAPDTFSKMTSMKRLVLSGNDLNSLEAGLFANLTHLESLELNSCGLRRPLNATVFFNHLTYTDLTELQLAGNPLRVSPSGALLPRQLSRLEILDLSNCNLTFLPNEAFRTTTKITHLILTGNLFSTAADLRFLTLLPRLNTIDLRYNKLTSLTPQDIDANVELEKVKLIGNPWRCDCWVSEFWNWVLEKKGNLQMLEGAILEDGDITVGKTKRKRLLICHVDAKTSTKKPRIGQATNRTWAKYVRESGCTQVNLKKPNQRLKREITIEEKLQSQANHSPNTWGHNLIYVTIFYIILLCVVYLLYIVLRRRNTDNQKIQ